MKNIEDRKKKIDNFFYYYKYHTFAAIVVIFVILAFIISGVGKVQPDLVVDYIGENGVSIPDFSNKMNDDFTKLVKDINKDGKTKILFQMINFSGGINMRQKALIETSAADTTAFILDEGAYLNYASGSLLQPMDDLAAKYKLDESKYPGITVKNNVTGENHIYGIPLETSSFLSSIDAPNKKLYYCVRDKKQAGESGSYKNNMYDNSLLVAENMAAGIK